MDGTHCKFRLCFMDSAELGTPLCLVRVPRDLGGGSQPQWGLLQTGTLDLSQQVCVMRNDRQARCSAVAMDPQNQPEDSPPGEREMAEFNVPDRRSRRCFCSIRHDTGGWWGTTRVAGLAP